MKYDVALASFWIGLLVFGAVAVNSIAIVLR
jgi:hypothetical protein